jgi:hypothetical protein
MLRLIPFAFIALVLTGCGASVAPQPPKAVEMFPPTEQVKALRLPLDTYSFSDAELYTISNAEDVLIARCLRGKGYPWELIKRPTDAPDLRNRRRYGVIEAKIAQFGYHVPTGLLTPISLERAYDKQDRTLSEPVKEAVFGANGCGRQAAEALGAADDFDQALLVQSSRSSLYDTLKEPPVAAALKSWRDCLHQAGLEYQDPLAAMADPAWSSNESAGPSKREITTATADVACKDKSALVETWHAAEIPVQDQAVKQHSSYFTGLRTKMADELDAAHAVLAQPIGHR